MSRLRVGFWVPTFSRFGGTETWHRMLLEGLDREQIEVAGIFVEDGEDEHVPEDLGCLPGALGECDVIVTWGIADLSSIHRVAGGNHPVVVMVAHGDGNFPEFVQANHDASPWVDHYVAVSEAALAAIPADRHGDTTVIRNGIETDRLVPRLSRVAQRDAWGVPQGAKVLGMVCRASREKDPRALTRALSCLPDYWYGVFVGDGPDLLDCAADAFGQGLTRLFTPGATDDVGSAYQAMDCLLLASLSEGFGYSALEAACFGIPVVATPVGILRDAQEQPQCPVTIVPGNSPGPVLAQAVERAMQETNTREGRLRLQILQNTILASYSAETFCRNWTHYLQRLPCRNKAELTTRP